MNFKLLSADTLKAYVKDYKVTLKAYVKDHKVISAILFVGLGLTMLRFTLGIAGVSNLDDNTPWGFWMSFDLLCGVALSAGGCAVAAAYHVFGIRHFGPQVRAALATAFLGYFFEVVALQYEVGQPWRLVYPLFWSPGTRSALFLVGLCVFLYLIVLFIELLPALFEYLGMRTRRTAAVHWSVHLAVAGAVIAIIHQSALGSLYLIAQPKVHPLWYSDFMPVLFLISSIFAGLCMVIIEGILAHKYLKKYMDEQHIKNADKVVLSCGNAVFLLMISYLFIRIVNLIADDNIQYLTTGYGMWFLVEIIGFVALPVFLLFIGTREKRIRLVKISAIITVLGVMLNRFNVSIIAFNYNLPPDERYSPSWMEIFISVFLVTLLLLAYRLMCAKMPILKEHDDYTG
ncbi:MAG: polysulfide reductase NrfD [Desulfovibrio sp.]|jgi:Ni/Fe-hydrogenase subunit HybB-like protein|nr:polysulfide reductase NrfD [Desulfovibrio sp.]